MVQKVLMIAGEASGDLHGAGVVRELRRKVPGVEVYGIGGDAMRSEGMDLVIHCAELSFMGFLEVVRNLGTVMRAERKLAALLEARKPDVVVLIDYPGFNLRFAKVAKRHGIPVLYYISPQVWAWHKNRVRAMKGRVDAMKVVFPFEVAIYEREGIDAEFVGHPLAERIGSAKGREQFFADQGFLSGTKLLGLFPGSRRQEIERILPTMVETARRVQRSLEVQVGISVAPNLGLSVLKEYVPSGSRMVLVENGTYDLMRHADAAIVTSGTATLEMGWFGTPMAVVYKTSPITYLIGRFLVDVPSIALVNIVAEKKIVPEFIQHHMSPENLAPAVERMLTDQDYSGQMRRELSIIKEKLGGPGASARVVDGVIALEKAA